MSGNLITQSPYLRTTRDFPSDPEKLTLELNKSYLDIAAFVNARVIGLFPTTRPSITGERWFITGNRRQQTLRQIYTFTAAGSIPHGINVPQTGGFTRIFGTFTDGTNWYPLPYVDVTAANNQVNIYVSPTNIVITAGAGAPPTIVSGLVVLEWLGNI